jgi:hypothetical protein
LSKDESFGLAVTIAEVDGVPVNSVLEERDEFRAAAQIARAMVAADRQEQSS